MQDYNQSTLANSLLSTQLCGNVLQVTLNAPQMLNALNFPMARQLLDGLKQWQNDDMIETIVLRGAGEKAFCAGGDIQQLYQHMRDQEFAQCDAFFDLEYSLDYALYTYPKPTIAFVDGIVMGGGMGLMQGCRHRVITDSLRMAMPETHIGLIPDVGSGDFLNCRPDRLEWLLPLTGGHATATDALFLGLADYQLARGQYESMIDGLQHEEADALLQHLHETNIQHIQPEISWIEAHADAITPALQKSPADVLNALKNIPAAEKFCSKADYASPLALSLTWQHLKDSRCLDRKAVLEKEYEIVTAMCRQGDFLEGIRALIMDKDFQPCWSNDSYLNTDKHKKLQWELL